MSFSQFALTIQSIGRETMEDKESTALIRVYQSGEFHWVGNGFPVRSVFGYNDLGRELSPFLLLDYAAPYLFPPGDEKRGVEAHPHRGFETVTIAYQGEIEHRDSSGGGGIIGPGDVQWMTAASGLIHEEFHSAKFTREGGTFEMIQLWVNLPGKFKSEKPGYQTLRAREIPRVVFKEEAELRVIAGEFRGHKGPAKTFTPIQLWEVTMAAQKSLELPLVKNYTKALFVLRGEVEVGDQKGRVGELVVIGLQSGAVRVSAETESKFLVMSGEPLREPIVGHGPFVMNTEAEIKQAFGDYRRGMFGTF